MSGTDDRGNNYFYESLSDPLNKEIFMGRVKPARVRAQTPDTIMYLVDGKDRLAGGSSFDFQVDCGKPLRALNATLSRVCIPKLPNVNAVNNVFQIRHITEGTGPTNPIMTGTIPVGFYNQNSFMTVFKIALDEAAAAAGLTDTFTVDYDNITKTMVVTSVLNEKWYFITGSPFITYGQYFVPFPSHNSTANVAGTSGQTSWYSSPIGLLYSRYIMIKSSRLSANAKEVCRTSSYKTNVIAVISLVDQMSQDDFDVTGVFNGSLILDTVVETSCNLNVAYHNKELGPIDFQIVDEYDFPLSKSLTLGGNFGPPTFDILIWLNFTV